MPSLHPCSKHSLHEALALYTRPNRLPFAVFAETPDAEDVIGAVSLVIWTITSLVLVKYALIVLRADDNGQG